jgi:hypothetical protein
MATLMLPTHGLRATDTGIVLSAIAFTRSTVDRR